VDLLEKKGEKLKGQRLLSVFKFVYHNEINTLKGVTLHARKLPPSAVAVKRPDKIPN
jgi:hypothetical protein